MIDLVERDVYKTPPECYLIDAYKQVLVFHRGDVTFLFNFNPTESYEGYFAQVPEVGKYRVVLSTDRTQFGGWARIDENYLFDAAVHPDGKSKVSVYLPARTALCLKKTDA